MKMNGKFTSGAKAFRKRGTDVLVLFDHHKMSCFPFIYQNQLHRWMQNCSTERFLHKREKEVDFDLRSLVLNTVYWT